MRIGLALISCVIWLTGCGPKDRLPSDILPREKMQAIVWDMMRADQYLSNYVLGRDSTIDKHTGSVRAYQQVLAVHNISKDDFTKSFEYYKANPLLLKEIMDSLSKTGVMVLAPPVKVITDPVSPVGEERLVDPDSASKPARRGKTPVN